MKFIPRNLPAFTLLAFSAFNCFSCFLLVSDVDCSLDNTWWTVSATQKPPLNWGAVGISIEITYTILLSSPSLTSYLTLSYPGQCEIWYPFFSAWQTQLCSVTLKQKEDDKGEDQKIPFVTKIRVTWMKSNTSLSLLKKQIGEKLHRNINGSTIQRCWNW